MWEQAKVNWTVNLFTLPGGYTISVGKLATVLLLFAAGYLVSRFAGAIVRRRLSSTKLRPDAIHAIQRIVFFVFPTLIFLVSLHLLGIPGTALAFAMGAVAIGAGFGTQNIVNNFISGWILMAERPVRVDDFIEFDA